MDGALLTPIAQCFRETISTFFNKAGRATQSYNKGDKVMKALL